MAIKRGDATSSFNSGSLSSSRGEILIPSSSDSLADSDFAPILSPTRQANILIYGAEKTGKTSFCTRFAPPPVMVLNFDGRADDAVFEAREELGRDVRIAHFFQPQADLPPDKMITEARAVLDRAMRNFVIAVEAAKRREVRSILWDTATEVDLILKLAFDGTLEKTKDGSHGKDKGFRNRFWWRVLNYARQAKSAHVIITARAKEIWKDQSPTGRFRPECADVVAQAVDWAGQIRLKTVFGAPRPEFELEITSAGTNIEELCEVYDASMWDKLGGPFVYACTMNYKDSSPEDWK